MCYHILEQFDETICLFKLMENAMVLGAELSIPTQQAFLGRGDAPFTYGWLCCNYQPIEQLDKTIRLFKLVENMHLLGHP